MTAGHICQMANYFPNLLATMANFILASILNALGDICYHFMSSVVFHIQLPTLWSHLMVTDIRKQFNMVTQLNQMANQIMKW